MFDTSILRWLVLLALLWLNTMLLAESHLQMMDTTVLMVEGEQACSGDTVTIAITTSQFDSITAFQFSLTWDASQVSLINSCNAFATNINFNPVGNSDVVVTWLESSGEALSLPDGDTLIVFKMNVINIPPAGIPISFGPLSPAEVIASNASGTSVFTPNTIDGLISFNDIEGQASATPITCTDTLASLSATALGESPTFEWFYDGSLYAQMIDTVAQNSGLYTLIVTSGNCMDTSFVELVYDTISPVVQAVAPDTIDCLNTSAILNAITSPDQSYFWLFPGFDTLTTNSLPTDTAGIYYLQIVNNQNGCFLIDTVEVVDIIDYPDIAILGDSLLSCAVDTILLSGQINTGSDNLTLSWQSITGDPLSTNNSLVLTQPQTYIFTAFDTTNFCSSSDSITISIDTIAPQASIVANDLLSCLKDTVALMANAVDNTVLFEWYDEQGALLSDSNSTLVTIQGFYELVVFDTINGCSTNLVQEILIDTLAPNASILNGAVDTLTCLDNELTLVGNSATPMTTVSWENIEGAVLSNTNELAVDTAGTFLFIVTDQMNGCDTTLQIIISTDTLIPDFTVPIPDAIDCSNDSVSLIIQATPELVCEWQGIAATCELSVTVPDTYIAVVTNPENGCFSTDTVIVLDNRALPVFQITNTGELNCTQTSVNLSPDSIDLSFEYYWLDEEMDTIAIQPEINTTMSGWYSLVVYDTVTLCTAMDSIFISQDTLSPTGTIPVPDTLTCINNMVSLEVQSSSPDVVVNWLNEAGDTLLFPQANEAGIYQVILLDTLNGCIYEDSVEVIVNQMFPVVEIGFSTDTVLSCNTPEIGLITLNTATNYSISWQNEQGTELSTDSLLSLNVAGSYYLQITDVSNSCTAIDSVLITDDFAPPQFSLSDTVATLSCNLGSISFFADSAINTTEFFWQDNNGIELSTLDSLTISTAGDYQLIAIDSLNGCADTLMFEVLASTDAPVINIAGDSLLSCSVETILLSGSSPQNAITFEWINQEGELLSDSASLIVEAPGQYELIAEDTINGCQSSLIQEVTSSTSNPQISIANGLTDTLSCISTMVLLEGSSTTSGVEVSWGNANGDALSDTNMLETDSAGTYYFFVTDTLTGCDTLLQITIISDTIAPALSLEMPDVLNCATDTVVLTLNSTPETSCMWEGNTSTNCVFAVTTPGFYTANVADINNGCVSIDSVEVIADYTLPELSVSDTLGVLGCTDEDFLFVGSSITENVQFSWQNDNGDIIIESSDLLTDLPGNYLLIAIDTINGCTDNLQVELQENTDAPTVSISGDTVLSCSVDSLFLLANSPLANLSFEWNNEGELISDAAQLLVTAPGQYELIATDTINGCQSVLSQLISLSTQAPLASILNGATDSLNCEFTSLILEGASGIGGMTDVFWRDEAGTILGDTTNIITIDSAGTYYFEVEDVNTGCDTSVQIIVVIDTLSPTLTIPSPGILNCQIDSVSLSIQTAPDNICSWNGTIMEDCTLTVATPGDYLAEVTSPSNGCTSAQLVTVEATTSPPEFDLQSTGAINCNTDTVTLGIDTALTDINYIWTNSTGDILSEEENLPVTSSGTYTLEVIDTITFCQYTDSIMVEANTTLPSGEIVNPPLLTCELDTIFLEAEDISDNTVLIWLDNNGALVPMGEVTEAGLYSMELTDTLNGCILLDTIEVMASTASPEVMLTFNTPTTITCDNETVSINAMGEPVNLNYIWQNTAGDIIAQSDEVIFVQAGDYSLTATNPLNGCEYDTTVMITENLLPPQLDIMLEQLFDCTTEQAVISTIENPIYLYQWTSPAGIITSPTEAATTVASMGEYLLEVTNTENGCTASGSINVTSIAEQISSVSFETIPVGCESLSGGTLIINDVNGSDATFQYAVDDDSAFGNNTLFNNLSVGEHQLFVEDPNGCIYDTLFIIGESTGHEVSIEVAENPIRLGETTTLNAVVNIPESSIVEIQWLDTKPLCGDSCSLSIDVSPLVSTTYIVQTTDAQGCISEALINLVVDSRVGVYVPNVFSPNDDGRNDVFYVQADDSVINIRKLSVFDRWGGLVFEKEDFQPNDPADGWDGRGKGELLNPGVFVYYLEVELLNNQEVRLSGDVILLR